VNAVSTTGASPRSARLGRNLGSAILVGVGLGVVIIASLVFVRQAFVGLVAVCVAVASWELATALRRGGQYRVVLPVLLVGGQAIVWLIWRMPGGADGYLRDVSASLFAAAYVPLFAAFGALLVLPADGAGRVLSFMICVVASDVGGYTFGVMFGRRPLAPAISPKKSWEGLFGSLVFGTVAGALSVSWLLDAPWPLGAVLGALLVVVATLGDLIESLIKRDVGIKDMGHLLPGHGGLMDRMDSLLPSAVVAWLLLSLFVPVR
jgi:phosphatidate cytidylyltransferase